jgi:hypothetical protein
MQRILLPRPSRPRSMQAPRENIIISKTFDSELSVCCLTVHPRVAQPRSWPSCIAVFFFFFARVALCHLCALFMRRVRPQMTPLCTYGATPPPKPHCVIPLPRYQTERTSSVGASTKPNGATAAGGGAGAADADAVVVAKAKAVFDFRPTNLKQLELKAGDIVEVLDNLSLWWVVRRADGKEGLVSTHTLVFCRAPNATFCNTAHLCIDFYIGS